MNYGCSKIFITIDPLSLLLLGADKGLRVSILSIILSNSMFDKITLLISSSFMKNFLRPRAIGFPYIILFFDLPTSASALKIVAFLFEFYRLDDFEHF